MNAANSRPDLNIVASPIVATSAVAVSLPIPGTSVDCAARLVQLLPGAYARLKSINVPLQFVLEFCHASADLSQASHATSSKPKFPAFCSHFNGGK
jgi:hypothetical protein